MNRIHAIALTAASAAILSLSCGAAMAQTVSGADPYQQGYAAGTSSKAQNSFNTFDRGFRAGQAAQSNTDSQAAGVQAYNSAQAYDRGFQAGIAQSNRDREQAYNEGYDDRALSDQRMADRAFDNGFDAGAYRQRRGDLDYP